MAVADQHTTPQTGEQSLKERYEAVRRRIAAAAEKAGRRAENIILVAVTKNASMDQIRSLIEMGHVDFGESRVKHLVHRAAQVDEFLERHRQLRTEQRSKLPKEVRWHLIGHLQRNKVRKAMDIARLVHSVDSLRLAEEIQQFATKRETPMEVLVQVNVANEKQKFGVAPAAAAHLVEQIETMVNVLPRGLMCIAPETDDPETVRPVFQRCAELFDDITKRGGECGPRFNILSMGMSSDFEVAIECGANVVRVGSAIFGPPSEQDDGTD